LEEIRADRELKKKQVKYAGVFILNIAAIVLTLLGYMVSYNSINTEVENKKFDLKEGQSFKVVNPGTIHEISFKIPYKTKLANFERNAGVLLDLYDPEGKRIYSFYKVLWWYQAASDDKGASQPLIAKIILNDKGIYTVKPYVVDDQLTSRNRKVVEPRTDGNLEAGMLTVKSKNSGSLYYFYLIILELVVLVAFLIFSGYLGSPASLLAEFMEKKSIVFKPIPLLYLGMICSFLILIIYWNYLGIGYAGYGGYLHSPNWFFDSNDVIYIG
jgi:hypothetical protein